MFQRNTKCNYKKSGNEPKNIIKLQVKTNYVFQTNHVKNRQQTYNNFFISALNYIVFKPVLQRPTIKQKSSWAMYTLIIVTSFYSNKKSKMEKQSILYLSFK